MSDDSKRYPHDAPVETEGMGGAGGGDLDDVGDVGFPRNATGRDVTRGRGVPEGMGGAGGGDIDDIGDVGNPDELQTTGVFPTSDMDVHDIRNISRAGSETIAGDTGVVTGITTGVDTDDATEAPGSPWEDLGDGLRESSARGTDTPTS
jgi:hypothetical protein